MFKKQFPSGRYYIGDLCYVVSDENWEQLLDDTDYFQKENQSYRGYAILAGDTTYGDGTYTDQYGRECPVDSGSIGIIPTEAIDKNCHRIGECGIVAGFGSEFTVEIDNGVFKFCDIVVDTKNFGDNNWY